MRKNGPTPKPKTKQSTKQSASPSLPPFFPPRFFRLENQPNQSHSSQDHRSNSSSSDVGSQTSSRSLGSGRSGPVRGRRRGRVSGRGGESGDVGVDHDGVDDSHSGEVDGGGSRSGGDVGSIDEGREEGSSSSSAWSIDGSGNRDPHLGVADSSEDTSLVGEGDSGVVGERPSVVGVVEGGVEGSEEVGDGFVDVLSSEVSEIPVVLDGREGRVVGVVGRVGGSDAGVGDSSSEKNWRKGKQSSVSFNSLRRLSRGETNR